MNDLDDEKVLNYLSTISKKFVVPSDMSSLNEAIDNYNLCWNYVKNKLPDRIDLESLKMKKMSRLRFVFGYDSILYHRQHLQKNAEILAEILKEKTIGKDDSPNLPPSFQMINSQFQQGFNLSSNQQISNIEININELKNILDLLKPLLNESSLSKEQKEEFDAELQTIESQIRSPKPKIKIISESLSSIMQLLEILKPLPLIPVLINRILSWLSSTNL